MARAPLTSKFDAVDTKQIRAEREAYGLTQTKASSLIGMNLKTWNHHELGKRPMDKRVFEIFKQRAQETYSRKESLMTPQEAIARQSASKTIKNSEPFSLSDEEVLTFKTNRSIYNNTLIEATRFINNLQTDTEKSNHALLLFGSRGSMRKRRDPEANAWRTATRKHLYNRLSD